MFLFFYLEGINFPSKYNVAPFNWPLPLSVLCQWLRQIIVSRNLSLLFSFGERSFVYNKSWNLDLSFWKQKLFQCEFKTICFWNLATPWLFFFLERRWFVLMLVILSLVKVHHKVTLCFCGFQSERLKKKLKVFS
jgi:hypothetical protein